MTEATIIDGKAFAAKLRERVGAEVRRITDAHGLKPNLAVILVGEDAASQVYVRTRVGKASAEGAARKDPGTPALAGRTGTCPNMENPGIPGAGKGLKYFSCIRN